MICESYGLVFGTNSFIALIMQSLLTIIVSDKRCLGLPVRQQYVIYTLLHVIIALIFLTSILINLIFYFLNFFKQRNKVNDTSINNKKDSIKQQKNSIINNEEDDDDENEEEEEEEEEGDIEQNNNYDTVEKKSSNGTASTDDLSSCSDNEDDEKNAKKTVAGFLL